MAALLLLAGCGDKASPPPPPASPSVAPAAITLAEHVQRKPAPNGILSTLPPPGANGPVITGSPEEFQTRRQHLKLETIPLPGGDFVMGSPDGEEDQQPPHPVTLAPFHLSRAEITNLQYQACVSAGVCPAPRWDQCFVMRSGPGAPWERGPASDKLKGPDQPVVCVEWEAAQTFAAWVGGTLPTEAQWEFAARGVQGRTYPWGNHPPDCERTPYHAEGKPGELEYMGCGRQTTAPVCTHPRGNTPDGICDLAGNVSEWVSDWYEPTYYQEKVQDNPRGPTLSMAAVRSVRGGSWQTPPLRLLAYGRGKWMFNQPADRIGFRVVINSPPKVEGKSQE